MENISAEYYTEIKLSTTSTEYLWGFILLYQVAISNYIRINERLPLFMIFQIFSTIYIEYESLIIIWITCINWNNQLWVERLSILNWVICIGKGLNCSNKFRIDSFDFFLYSMLFPLMCTDNILISLVALLVWAISKTENK